MKKNILLLGDSIRMGYQDYVKEKLCNIANVYYPNDNGRFAQMTLRYFHDWSRILSDNYNIEFDIIHFNTGLWDVLRLSNEEECFNPPDEYRILLNRLLDRMRYFYPKAQFIFALTTKVNEPGFIYGEKIAIRRNSDIKMYNKIAIEEMSKQNIPITDLWRVSEICGIEGMSDDVHYNTVEGIRLLGNAVVESIRKYID